MKITYYSLNSGGICKAEVPTELEQKLKTKWFLHQQQFKKLGIKTFEEYVKTVYSFNV